MSKPRDTVAKLIEVIEGKKLADKFPTLLDTLKQADGATTLDAIAFTEAHRTEMKEALMGRLQPEIATACKDMLVNATEAQIQDHCTIMTAKERVLTKASRTGMYEWLKADYYAKTALKMAQLLIISGNPSLQVRRLLVRDL